MIVYTQLCMCNCVYVVVYTQLCMMNCVCVIVYDESNDPEPGPGVGLNRFSTDVQTLLKKFISILLISLLNY